MLKEKRLDLSELNVGTEVELFLNHFKEKSSSTVEQKQYISVDMMSNGVLGFASKLLLRTLRDFLLPGNI